MGPVGWQEMMFIFLLALVIFGPKKLPELGRNLGKALTEFRKASNELKATFDRELINLERESQEIKEATSGYLNDTYHETYNYDYDSSYYDSGSTEGSPALESHDSTATNSSSVGAPASEGAESTATPLESAEAAQVAAHEASPTEAHSEGVSHEPADHEAAKPVAS